jgi:hypothetical protein
VYGLFRIPSDNNLKFRTGEKKFRLTDNAKNSSALGLCLTSSQAIYSSQGLATSSQDTTMSTRNAQLTFNKTSDNQTLTSSATNITGSGQRTVGRVEIPAPVVNNITNVSQTIINDTMVGGATLTKLLGTSAWYAPGAAGAALVESIVRDEKKLFTCCVSLNGEYGQNDICLGVPVVIGKNGWEKIVEMDLSADEQAAFNKSADAVRNMNDVLKTL